MLSYVDQGSVFIRSKNKSTLEGKDVYFLRSCILREEPPGYKLRPGDVDWSTFFDGSVRSLQMSVERGNVFLPKSGVHIQSKRLTKERGTAVFYYFSCAPHLSDEENFMSTLHPCRQRILLALRKQDFQERSLHTGRSHSASYQLFLQSLASSSDAETDNFDGELARTLKKLKKVDGIKHAANSIKLKRSTSLPKGGPRSRIRTGDFLNICFAVSKFFIRIFPRCKTLAEVLSKDMQLRFQALVEYLPNKVHERQHMADFTPQKDAIWFKNEETLLRYISFAHHILRLRCMPGKISDEGSDEGPIIQDEELDALLQVYNKTVRVVHNQVLQQISEQMFRFALPQRQYCQSIDLTDGIVREVYLRLDRICLLLNKELFNTA